MNRCLLKNQFTGCSNDRALHGNICVTECLSATYLAVQNNYNVCSRCDLSCLNCSLSANNCSLCRSGYLFFNSSCLDICPSDYYAYGQQCLSHCPDMFFAETASRTCLPCNSVAYRCKTCESESRCLECVSGALFYPETHQCVASCPGHTYKLENVCLVCSGKCQECETETKCLSCNTATEFKFLDIQFSTCVPGCADG